MRRPGSGHQWLIGVAAQLQARGFDVYARDLAGRDFALVLRAACWAELGEPLHAMPGFLRRFARPGVLPPDPRPAPRGGAQLSLSLDERTQP